MIRVSNNPVETWKNEDVFLFIESIETQSSLPKDKNQRLKWIEKLELTENDLSKAIYVCSDHFVPENYFYAGSSLKSNAVLNKNLNYEESASRHLLSTVEENFTLHPTNTGFQINNSLLQNKQSSGSSIFINDAVNCMDQHESDSSASGKNRTFLSTQAEINTYSSDDGRTEFSENKESTDDIVSDDYSSADFPQLSEPGDNSRVTKKRYVHSKRSTRKIQFYQSDFKNAVVFEKFKKYATLHQNYAKSSTFKILKLKEANRKLKKLLKRMERKNERCLEDMKDRQKMTHKRSRKSSRQRMSRHSIHDRNSAIKYNLTSRRQFSCIRQLCSRCSLSFSETEMINGVCSICYNEGRKFQSVENGADIADICDIEIVDHIQHEILNEGENIKVYSVKQHLSPPNYSFDANKGLKANSTCIRDTVITKFCTVELH